MKQHKPVAWRRVIGNVTKHYEYNEIGVGAPLYDLETVRQQQAEIEALKEGVEKLKDAYCQRDSEVKKLKDEAKKAEQSYLNAFDRGKQIGYAEGMISRKAQEK